MDHRDALPGIDPRLAPDRRPEAMTGAPEGAAEGAPERAGERRSERAPVVVLCDAGSLRRPDIGTVDELARLALALRRLGCRFEIRHASPELRDLLALAGLDGALPCSDASGLEAER